MLSDKNMSVDRACSVTVRGFAGGVLLAVAASVFTLHSPVRGAGDQNMPNDPVRNEPFDLSYLRDDTMGVIALRPAAAFQRASIGRLGAKANTVVREGIAGMAGEFGFYNEEAYKSPLPVEDIEQVTFGFDVSVLEGHKEYNRRLDPHSLMVRMTKPFDWVKQLRAWKFDLTEIRDGGLIYYTWKWPNPKFHPAIYCPDDRTLVFDWEEKLLVAIQRKLPAVLSVTRGGDWDRVSRGLFAVALDNRKGDWTQSFKGSRAEQMGVPLFEHAELWVLGLANQDDILFQAVATCVDARSTEPTARAAEALLSVFRLFADDPNHPRSSETEEARARLIGEFVKKTHAEHAGRSVVVRSAGLGTFADFVSLIVPAGSE
jgi:hypothetical protein